jgi:hypothetical protein
MQIDVSIRLRPCNIELKAGTTLANVWKWWLVFVVPLRLYMAVGRVHNAGAATVCWLVQKMPWDV